MNHHQRFNINKAVVYREEEEGAFLFDPETGNLKYMNSCGKELFLMLKDQSNLGQAMAYLTAKFPDIKRQQIEDDAETFIGQLEENGFIFPLSE